jgi:aldehyde dehydrogenase (NAD+)
LATSDKAREQPPFTLINASTEELIGIAPEACEADVDAAVAAARRALCDPAWAGITPLERAEIMERFMEAIAARGEELARMVSAQNGMPISISVPLEGQFSVGVMQYYAGLARTMGQLDVRPSQMGSETLVEAHP